MAFFLSRIVIKPQQSFLISIWGYLSKQYQIWNIPKVIIIYNAIPPRKSNPWNESQRVSLSWFNTKQIRHLEYSPFTCENIILPCFLTDSAEVPLSLVLGYQLSPNPIAARHILLENNIPEMHLSSALDLENASWISSKHQSSYILEIINI